MNKNHNENCTNNCQHKEELEDLKEEQDYEDEDQDYDYDYEDEMDIIYLTLEDDTELECSVLGIFEVEDNEYIALAPFEEDEVFLYRYVEDGEDFELINIEDDEEFEIVSEAYELLFGDDMED